MKFEEALKAMREGKYARLDNREFKIDECGDLVELLEDFEYNSEYDTDFWYWSLATLETYDIMSEDWEVVDD